MPYSTIGDLSRYAKKGKKRKRTPKRLKPTGKRFTPRATPEVTPLSKYAKAHKHHTATRRRATKRSRNIYRKAKSVSGLRGKMPKVKFDVPMTGAKGQHREGVVRLSHGTTSGLAARGKHDEHARQDARLTLLHELAHTQQTTKGRRLREGGAEQFAHRTAKKLGLVPKDYSETAYPKMRKQVRSRRTGRFIRRGQFR